MSDYKSLVNDIYQKKGLDTSNITDETISTIQDRYGDDVGGFLGDLYDKKKFDKSKLTPEAINKITQRYGFSQEPVSDPYETKQAPQAKAPQEPGIYDSQIAESDSLITAKSKEIWDNNYGDNKLEPHSGEWATRPSEEALNHDIQNYQYANQILQSAKEHSEAPTKWNDFGVFKGFVDQNWKDIASVGINETARELGVYAITKKQKKGEELTDSEEYLLEAYKTMMQAQEENDPSMVYNGIKAIPQMIPYIVQMALTGGAATVGKKASEALIKKTITKGTESLVRRGSRAVVGLGVEAGVRTAVSPQMIITDAARRMNTGREDNEGVAVLKGIVNTYFEFFGEGSGDLMKRGVGLLGKTGTKAGKKAVGGFMDNFKKLTRFDGLPYEYMEELFTEALQSGMMEGEWSSFADPEFHGELLISLGALSGAYATMNKGQRYGVTKRYNASVKELEGINPENLDLVMQVANAEGGKEKSILFNKLSTSGILSDQEKEIAARFLMRKTTYDGMISANKEANEETYNTFKHSETGGVEAVTVKGKNYFVISGNVNDKGGILYVKDFAGNSSAVKSADVESFDTMGKDGFLERLAKKDQSIVVSEEKEEQRAVDGFLPNELVYEKTPSGKKTDGRFQGMQDDETALVLFEGEEEPMPVPLKDLVSMKQVKEQEQEEIAAQEAEKAKVEADKQAKEQEKQNATIGKEKEKESLQKDKGAASGDNNVSAIPRKKDKSIDYDNVQPTQLRDALLEDGIEGEEADQLIQEEHATVVEELDKVEKKLISAKKLADKVALRKEVKRLQGKVSEFEGMLPTVSEEKPTPDTNVQAKPEEVAGQKGAEVKETTEGEPKGLAQDGEKGKGKQSLESFIEDNKLPISFGLKSESPSIAVGLDKKRVLAKINKIIERSSNTEEIKVALNENGITIGNVAEQGVVNDFIDAIKKSQPKGGKVNPEVDKAADLEQAEASAATSPDNDLPEPSDAQKEAGNSKLGHTKQFGLNLSIENPVGSERKGTDPSGKAWSIKMNNTYGYIKGTIGKDKDHIDNFIGPDLSSDKVFIIDQVNEDGTFDEHKVMLGFNSQEEAEQAYLSNYEEGWDGLGETVPTDLANFKKWALDGKRKSKAASEYAMFGAKKKESAKAKGIIQRAGEIDQFDPIGKVMQYFVNGGRINTSAIQQLFGNKGGKSIEGERKSRISYLKKDGATIDGLAHALWQEDVEGNYDTSDYREAVEEVIRGYNSPSAMAKDLLERENDKEEVSPEEVSPEEAEYNRKADERALVDEVTEAMHDDLFQQGLLPTEEEIVNLQVQAYYDGQQTDKQGEVQGANPTESEGIREGEQREPTGSNRGRSSSPKGANVSEESEAVTKLKANLKRKKNERKKLDKEFNDRNGFFGDSKAEAEKDAMASKGEQALFDVPTDISKENYDRTVGQLDKDIKQLESAISKQIASEATGAKENAGQKEIESNNDQISKPTDTAKKEEGKAVESKPSQEKKDKIVPNNNPKATKAQTNGLIKFLEANPSYSSDGKPGFYSNGNVVYELKFEGKEVSPLDGGKIQFDKSGGIVNEPTSPKKYFDKSVMDYVDNLFSDGYRLYNKTLATEKNINAADLSTYPYHLEYALEKEAQYEAENPGLRSKKLEDYYNKKSGAKDTASPPKEKRKKRKSFTDAVKKGLNETEINRLDELRNKLKGKMGGQLNSGLDPETFMYAAEATSLVIKSGFRQFKDYVNAMVDYLGDGIKPHLAALYEYSRRADSKEFASEMTPTAEVDSTDIEQVLNEENDVTLDNENQEEDVSDRTGNSEQDSGNESNDSPVDQRDIPNQPGTSGGNGGNSSSGSSKKDKQPKGSQSSLDLFSDIDGEQSDNDLSTNEPVDDTGNVDTNGSSESSTDGLDVDNRGNESSGKDVNGTNGSESFGERVERTYKEQKAAESTTVKVGDRANIAETLPFLLEDQLDDVYKAEDRFNNPKHNVHDKAYGKGILFTNGTGTGKTYTGLGIIKRFVKQGKDKIMIVVPSQPKVMDWAEDGENLQLNITPLKDKKDKGTGVRVTTYANFRDNPPLLDEDFDLIVYDESHRLLEAKKGKPSNTTDVHYAMSNKTESEAFRRITSIHPLWIKAKELQNRIRENIKTRNNPDMMLQMYQDYVEEGDKMDAELKEIREEQKRVEPELKKRAEAAFKKTKVVFLSATPFKEHKNLRYVNGLLFDWGDKITYEQASRVRSRVDAESRFFLDNFGGAYHWRNHRLEDKPDANPDAIAMQEVEFAEKLMGQGLMSGRAIESPMDYSREFPLVSGFNSKLFNTAYNDIYNYGDEADFESLKDAAHEVFNSYNYTTMLFEALKTSMSIGRIEKHLDMGRNVVVFHRRKQAHVGPPFKTIVDITETNANSVLADKEADEEEKEKARTSLGEIDAFKSKYAELFEYEQTLNYHSAINQILEAFGEESVRFLNGDVTSKKAKKQAAKDFNDDNSPVRIIVVQEDAGKEGISLHDKTGKHQRVLISLSMPISPTTALQIEGRIFRIGNESNAIFEYPLLGLDSEIAYFGQNINRRLSTTENLAVGNQSRDLIRSYAEGVLFNSSEADPNNEQGLGGKEYDKKELDVKSNFQKAKLVYSTNQKQRGRRDQRKGVDYFATPEPVGQKMVEWLDLKSQDHVLEPSGGHGAIAMWFPSSAKSTAIEPSYELFAKLSARVGGAEPKIINERFENHHIVNKYHGIAMNPPYGVGGKTAMEHLDKAFSHLKEGGRVIAIIPNGPSMQKRLDKFLYGENEKGKLLNPEAKLRAEIEMPGVMFEQAGTSVNSKIVIIDRIPIDQQEELGGASGYNLNHLESVNEIFDEIEFMDVPARTEITEPVKAEESRKESGNEGTTSSTTDNAETEKEGGFETFEQNDTRTGATLYMAKPRNYLEDDYQTVNGIAKSNGGYYSKYRNKAQGVKRGFLFKTEEARKNFLNEIEAFQNDNDIRFRSVSPSGFFSTIEDALDKIQQKKGTPEQFRAMLLKNGAKQAEMDWMGFEDAFTEKSVTKAEIKDWIDANKIEVEEVEKGSKQVSFTIDDLDVDGIIETDDRWYFDLYKENTEGDTEINVRKSEAETKEEAIDVALEELNSQVEEGDTFHSQYQEPGGENYKELLLTMPSKSGLNKLAGFNSISEANKRAEKLKQDYHVPSAHQFTEPNILAHVRFNERYDSNGNKVLFLEEIQSDWAQEGKKKGFEDAKKIEIIKAEQSEVSGEINKLKADGISKNYKELSILNDTWDSLQDQINKFSGVPNMPFKKTDQWINLGLRRMIRYAAENGFDRIAWTTGEQQADRYSLAKQVDDIAYIKNDDGTYTYEVSNKEKQEIFEENVTIDRIEEVIGKELASKIQEGVGESREMDGQTFTHITGLDLKVGGKGMKTFYNSIVPKAAGKLGKKFGAKVEAVDLGQEMEADMMNGISQEEIDAEYAANPDAKRMQVMSLPITESMKLSALSGFPLFSALENNKGFAKMRGVVLIDHEIRQELGRLAEKYGVPVKIINSVKQLPPHLEEQARKEEAKGNHSYVKGVYDTKTDTTYYLLPNLKDKTEAREVFLHEGVVHYGLRKMLGNDFYSILQGVYSSLPQSDIDKYRETLKIDNPLVIAEEYLAYTAEKDVKPSWYKRVLSEIRDLIRKVYGLKYTLNDIHNLIQKSKRNLEAKKRNEDLIDARAKDLDNFIRNPKTWNEKYYLKNYRNLGEIVSDEVQDSKDDIYKTEGWIKDDQRTGDNYADREQLSKPKLRQAVKGQIETWITDLGVKQFDQGLFDYWFEKLIRVSAQNKDKVAGDNTFHIAADIYFKLPENTNPPKPRKQTDTEAFKKWFGDSKVVDEKGEPLVVYHGTRADFDKFGAKKDGFANKHRLWYFTKDVNMANSHAGGSKAAFKNMGSTGSIMPVYLSLKNPKIFNSKSQDDQDVIEEVGYWATDKQLDEFESQGYDGLMLDDMSQIIALSPTQIKSATGNNGGFDPNNPDIRFRVADSQEELNDFVKDSKVKETVYHGTTARFNDFSPERLGVSTLANSASEGFFFTDNKTVAQTYADFTPNHPDYIREKEARKNRIKAIMDELDTMRPMGDEKLSPKYDAKKWKALVDEWNALESKVLPQADPNVMNVKLDIKNPLIADFKGEAYSKGMGLTDLINKAKDKEYDAVIVKNIYDARQNFLGEEGTGTNYIVFSPDQILIEPKDDTANDIRFSKSVDLGKNTPNLEKVENFSKKLERKFVDRVAPYKRFQEWAKAIGANVNFTNDFMMAENRQSSIARAKVDKYKEGERKALIDAAAPLYKHKGYEAFSEYMMVKHAPERNKELLTREAKAKGLEEQADIDAFISEVEDDNRSGYTTEEANDIINAFESGLSKSDIDTFWKAVKSNTNYVLQQWLDTGLIDQDTYDHYSSMYQHYVPLRGWDKEQEEDVEYFRDTFTGKVNVNKKAEGRDSKADDPLATIVNMVYSSITIGEKNHAKQKAYYLVRRNVDLLKPQVELKEYWEVPVGEDMVEYYTNDEFFQLKPELREGAKKVYARSKQSKMSTGQANEHEVNMWVNGKMNTLVFKDVRIARALNSEVDPTLRYTTEVLQQSIGKATRRLSALLTSDNPAFIIPNLIRDTLFAVEGTFIEHGSKQALELSKNIFKVQKALIAHQKGEVDNSELGKMLKDFVDMGGQTGYSHMESIETIKKSLKKELRLNSITEASKLADYAVNGIKKPFELIEHLAAWSENVSRFATYVTAVNNGASKAEAIKRSKDVTVNFNRKGELSSAIGSLFMFFNARMQGIARVFTLAKDHPKRFAAVAATHMAIGYASSLIFQLLRGDDDDDEDGKQVSDYMKYRYLLIPGGDKSYVSIPLPHGTGFFHGLGVMMYELASGKKNALEVSGNAVGNALSEFAPVDVASVSIDKSVTENIAPFVPSVVKPMYDIFVTNKNYMDRDIAKKPFTKADEDIKARSQMYYKNVNPVAKMVTDLLFELGGGEKGSKLAFKKGTSEKVKGIMDSSPDGLEYLVTSYTGGLGKFVNDVFKTLVAPSANAIKEDGPFIPNYEKYLEENVSKRDIPVFNRFIRSYYGNSIMGDYYDKKHELEVLGKWEKEFKDNRDMDSRKELRSDPKYLQYRKMKQYDSRVKRYSDRLKRDDLTPEKREEYESKRLEYMKEFLNLEEND